MLLTFGGARGNVYVAFKVSHTDVDEPQVYSKLPGEVEFCVCQGRKDVPNLVIWDILPKIFKVS